MYTAFKMSLSVVLCMMKNYLITGDVEWTDPRTSKMGTFLVALSLSVKIFNKQSYQTRAEECFKQKFQLLL